MTSFDDDVPDGPGGMVLNSQIPSSNETPNIKRSASSGSQASGPHSQARSNSNNTSQGFTGRTFSNETFSDAQFSNEGQQSYPSQEPTIVGTQTQMDGFAVAENILAQNPGSKQSNIDLNYIHSHGGRNVGDFSDNSHLVHPTDDQCGGHSHGGHSHSGDPHSHSINGKPISEASHITRREDYLRAKQTVEEYKKKKTIWCNCEPAGVICVSIAYLAILGSTYYVNFSLIGWWWIPTTHISSYDHHFDNADDDYVYIGAFSTYSTFPWYLKIPYLICFNGAAICAIWCHLTCMLTDPGSVPIVDNRHPNAQLILDEYLFRLGYDKDLESHNPRQCRHCKQKKPDRAHHCSTCKRCILKMDHHCPWVNNCVGLLNQKHFLLFLLYVNLMCSTCLWGIGMRTYDCAVYSGERWQNYSFFWGTPLHDSNHTHPASRTTNRSYKGTISPNGNFGEESPFDAFKKREAELTKKERRTSEPDKRHGGIPYHDGSSESTPDETKPIRNHLSDGEGTPVQGGISFLEEGMFSTDKKGDVIGTTFHNSEDHIKTTTGRTDSLSHLQLRGKSDRPGEIPIAESNDRGANTPGNAGPTAANGDGNVPVQHLKNDEIPDNQVEGEMNDPIESHKNPMATELPDDGEQYPDPPVWLVGNHHVINDEAKYRAEEREKQLQQQQLDNKKKTLTKENPLVDAQNGMDQELYHDDSSSEYETLHERIERFRQESIDNPALNVCSPDEWQIVGGIVFVFVSLVFGLFTIAMGCDQISAITSDQTLIEKLQAKRERQKQNREHREMQMQNMAIDNGSFTTDYQSGMETSSTAGTLVTEFIESSNSPSTTDMVSRSPERRGRSPGTDENGDEIMGVEMKDPTEFRNNNPSQRNTHNPVLAAMQAAEQGGYGVPGGIAGGHVQTDGNTTNTTRNNNSTTLTQRRVDISPQKKSKCEELSEKPCPRRSPRNISELFICCFLPCIWNLYCWVKCCRKTLCKWCCQCCLDCCTSYKECCCDCCIVRCFKTTVCSPCYPDDDAEETRKKGGRRLFVRAMAEVMGSGKNPNWRWFLPFKVKIETGKYII